MLYIKPERKSHLVLALQPQQTKTLPRESDQNIPTCSIQGW